MTTATPQSQRRAVDRRKPPHRTLSGPRVVEPSPIRVWLAIHKFTLVQILGFIIIIGAVFLQSYNGRVDVVQSNRAGCERSASNLAAQVNDSRAEYVANVAIANSNAVPKSVRRSRAAAATVELQGINVLDSHIDRGHWRELKFAEDRNAVANGVRIGRMRLPVFRCNVAYPSTSPFVFVR